MWLFFITIITFWPISRFYFSLPLLAISRNDNVERELCLSRCLHDNELFVLCTYYRFISSSDGGHSPHNHRLSSLSRLPYTVEEMQNYVRKYRQSDAAFSIVLDTIFLTDSLSLSLSLHINHWQFLDEKIF